MKVKIRAEGKVLRETFLIEIPPRVMDALNWQGNDEVSLDIVVNRDGSPSHLVVSK